MKFLTTPFKDAWIIELEPHDDSRGSFARTVCRNEFRDIGIDTDFVQQSFSHNIKKGIIRGLHYQTSPFEEGKLIRVTRGAVFDVIVDLRKGSSSFGKWFGIELSVENNRQLFVPKGFGHGFQTLSENADVFYQMTEFYQPNSGRCIRWDDPEIGIIWPLKVSNSDRSMLSEADSKAPFLSEL